MYTPTIPTLVCTPLYTPGIASLYILVYIPGYSFPVHPGYIPPLLHYAHPVHPGYTPTLPPLMTDAADPGNGVTLPADGVLGSKRRISLGERPLRVLKS